MIAYGFDYSYTTECRFVNRNKRLRVWRFFAGTRRARRGLGTFHDQQMIRVMAWPHLKFKAGRPIYLELNGVINRMGNDFFSRPCRRR
jgi:hypothetical protein